MLRGHEVNQTHVFESTVVIKYKFAGSREARGSKCSPVISVYSHSQTVASRTPSYGCQRCGERGSILEEQVRDVALSVAMIAPAAYLMSGDTKIRIINLSKDKFSN